MSSTESWDRSTRTSSSSSAPPCASGTPASSKVDSSGLSRYFDIPCASAPGRSIGEGTVPAPVPLPAMKLVLLGGGRMGEALLTGLLRSGWAARSDVAVVEKLEPRRKALADLFPGVEVRADPCATDGVV